jgi:hypothetical protein
VPLVLGGAIAAAAGRLVLAHGARASRARLSPERREHLARTNPEFSQQLRLRDR